MPDFIKTKIGLGTVQFGLDYGVSNDEGKTSSEEVSKILDIADSENVCIIDTARLYGDSEKVLGQYLNNHASSKIVTKTICFRKDEISEADSAEFKEEIETSLDALQTKKIYGLLIHHADDLIAKGGDKLFQVMQAYKDEGIISKIGVSVYDGVQIDKILDLFDIDLIQIPLNVFDSRLIESGHVKKLKNKNIEIHVRSAFLQGVVFMNPDELPPKLKGLKKPLQHLNSLATEHNLEPMEVALSYLQHNPQIDCIICGVNNAKQFAKLCKISKNLPNLAEELFLPLAINDPILVNPANW